MRKKILEMIVALQNQKIVPLWALANESIIFDAATNQKHTWQNKSRKIFILMKIVNKIKMSDFLIFFIGLMWLCKSFLKVRKKQLREKCIPMSYKKIFVGHGATAENFIFSDYCKNRQYSTLHINVITLDGLEKIHSPAFLTLVKLLFTNSFGISSGIKKLSRNLSLCAEDFLTCAALNVGEYIFFRAYWRLVKLNDMHEVTFLALYVASHGCMPEKVNFQYWSHGLMRLSMIMIKANHIGVITPEEQSYMKFIFNNNVNCDLIKKYHPIHEKKNNSILIMSPEHLMVCSTITHNKLDSLIRWANTIGLEIILRPSPICSAPDLWLLSKKLPDCDIDDVSVDLEERLKILKPKFIVGYNTTGLFSALCMGIIPISFWDPNDPAWNLIYPMKLRALFWPRDQFLINALVNAEDLYRNNLAILLNSVDEEFGQLFPAQNTLKCCII